MSFNFVIPEFNIGGAGTPPLEFFRKGFNLGGSGSSPEWKDIILSGNTALTLANAKANGLNYLKLFGGCKQSGTPTPTVPVDIISNNGAIKYSANMANVNAQTALIGYYISNSGVVTADANNWMYQDFIPVKPNTTYTLTMSTPVYFVTITEYSTANDSGFIRRNAGSSGDNTTLTIITGSTTNFVRFGMNIDRTEVTLEEVLAINWMLNEGNSKAYQPYVEGGIYADGTIETVEVTGKNLFDRDTVDQNFVSGKIKNNNGEEVNDATSTYSTTYIKVSPSTSYIFSWIGGSAVIQRIYYYTENKQWISRTQSTFGQSPAIFTTPNNCEYIQIQRQTSVYVAATNIQLELGSTATEYEPYYYGGQATAEMLLKVGDYQDIQSVLDGNVTRKVGFKALTGSENVAPSGTGRFSIAAVQAVPGAQLLSTHYKYKPSATDDGSIGTASSGVLLVRMNNMASVDAIRAFFKSEYDAGHPVIVVYPLATPTTESVTGQPLTIQAGSNVVEITQASIDNLELEVSYKGTV